jgi:hypothetical protein
MSRLTPSEKDKLTKLMGELNKRVCNHPNLSSSLSSSLSTHSSISPIISSSAFIIDNDGSDTSSDVDSNGDTNVIGDSNNQKYDDNSTLLDALRNSESAQQIDLDYSYTPYPSKDITWEFPASVEITYEPSKMERLAHAIFYSIATDNVTWIWVALYLLTSY